jgi:hypothetical protein
VTQDATTGLHIVTRRNIAVIARIVSIVLISGVAILAAEPPSIVQQPASRTAGETEDVSFSVSATGDPPLSYQWLFNSSALAGQTNTFLLLTNLTTAQAGSYSVTITNAAGATNSAPASLLVVTSPFRRIATGAITASGNSATVPITLSGSGRESSVGFSLAYGTNFSNPTFASSNLTATVTTDTSTNGVIGVAITLAPGEMFSVAGAIGSVTFDVAPGKGALDGALKFAAAPIPVAAANTNAQQLSVLASVEPTFSRITPDPILRLQSGLFEHQITVGNPSAFVMTNVEVSVLVTNVDSRTNQIVLFNGESPVGFPPSAFGAVDIENLLPGESRVLTLEYLVPDHATVPAVFYGLAVTDPVTLTVPASFGKSLSIDLTRFLSNSVIVEFTTKLGSRYLLQYADTPEGVSTGKVAFPAVVGTGSRVQWIDNGPPKTATAPTNQQRFYRVLTDER